jgi:hypothetical protein
MLRKKEMKYKREKIFRPKVPRQGRRKLSKESRKAGKYRKWKAYISEI